MGHASPETTSRYVHYDDHELAAEHRRIERLQHDPSPDANTITANARPTGRFDGARMTGPRPGCGPRCQLSGSSSISSGWLAM